MFTLVREWQPAPAVPVCFPHPNCDAPVMVNPLKSEPMGYVSLTLRRLAKVSGGQRLHVASFLRVQCGEGLEASNKALGFAEEVAKMAAA